MNRNGPNDHRGPYKKGSYKRQLSVIVPPPSFETSIETETKKGNEENAESNFYSAFHLAFRLVLRGLGNTPLTRLTRSSRRSGIASIHQFSVDQDDRFHWLCVSIRRQETSDRGDSRNWNNFYNYASNEKLFVWFQRKVLAYQCFIGSFPRLFCFSFFFQSDHTFFSSWVERTLNSK